MTEKAIGQGTAEYVRQITETKLGVKVSENVIEEWVCLARLIRTVDDLVDGEKDDNIRKGMYSQAISYLSHEAGELAFSSQILREEAARLKTYLNLLPLEQKELFIRSLRNLFRFSEKFYQGFCACPYDFCIRFGVKIFFFQKTIVYVIRINFSLRNFKFKPFLQRIFKTNSVHIIE